jgi:asparagine synthase (glutamine-hydrolysing)
LAAGISVVTKPLGMSGMFYHVAGREAAAIDGPTEYSLYPSNVSAKLPPKRPHQAAAAIRSGIMQKLPKNLIKNFTGAAIIDANDLGRTVLGIAADMSPGDIEKIFVDNPMGQANEQTPIVVVFVS